MALSNLDIQEANKIVLASPVSKGVGGFSLQQLSNATNLQPFEAFTLLKMKAGVPATDLDREILATLKGRSTASPKYSGLRNNVASFNWFVQYYTDHPVGSHYGGDFNVGSALQRAFTFKPSSFTLTNLIRTGSAGTILIATGGASTFNPQINGHTIVSSDTHSAKPGILDSAIVGGNSFGTVRAGDPNKPEDFFNRIARVTGGAISSIATGKAFAKGFSTPENVSGGNPSTVYGPSSPFTATQKFGNFAVGVVNSFTSGLTGANVSQFVIAILGPKIGSFILALGSGDIRGAVNIISGSGPNQNPQGGSQVIYRDNPNSGGGGGGGTLVAPNTGQSSNYTLLYVGVGVAVLTSLVFYLRRK